MGALLVDSKVVTSRLDIDDSLAGTDVVINSAIVAAQLRFGAAYQTELHRTETTDIFYLDSNRYNSIQSKEGLVKLMTTNAFIKELKIYSGRRWNECTKEIPEGDYVLDKERGLIHLDSYYLDGHVKIEYTSGFEIPEELPSWVTEAILSIVPTVMSFGQPTNRNAEADTVTRQAYEHACAIILAHRRDRGLCYKPLE